MFMKKLFSIQKMAVVISLCIQARGSNTDYIMPEVSGLVT